MALTDFKNKLNRKIDNCTFLDNEIKMGLINFVVCLLILITCVACVLSSNQNNTSNSVVIGLVYGLYLPLAIVNIGSCCLVSLSTIKKYKKQALKVWFFYLPLVIIFLELIVLPIPLTFLAWTKINPGILWSIIVFASICLGCGIANFLGIYKTNLTDLSYTIQDENKDEKPSSDQPLNE